MEKSVKVHEKFLYEIWKKQNFNKNLSTSDDQQIIIVDPGVENKELGGPDFKNSRIKIGNITFLGDVEIDSYYSDWKAHGHNLNKKYNRVILHVVLNENTNHNHHFVYTQDGRRVISICLNNFLDESLKTNVQKAIVSERSNRINKMPCNEINSLITVEEKTQFIGELGALRFRKKCDKILERLKELSYIKENNIKEPIVKYELDDKFYTKTFTQKDFSDKEIWEQLIYESVFEALGYSKNKEIMLKLAHSVEIKFLKTFINYDDFIGYLESALFNIAGIIHDVKNIPDEETAIYMKKLCEHWVEIKEKYDGRIYNSSQWHFFKLRPQNFPTIRLAGGARIIKKLLKENFMVDLIKSIEKIDNLKTLANTLRSFIVVKGEGYWKTHFVFDQSAKTEINYFIGVSRADEIIVNVILPILLVYCEIFDKKEEAKRIKKLYQNFYQKSENKLVGEVADTLLLQGAGNRSILYQGMIELFRSYCSKGLCTECTIGKKVFN